MLYSELNSKKVLIKKYLKQNFPLIFSIEEPVFLLGGALKNIIYENEDSIKYLDFVIIDDDNLQIQKFLQDNNLEYSKNSFNGYKIHFNDIYIDIWTTQDLYECIEYNFDGLFYDIKNDIILSFGYFNSINKKLLKINYDNEHPSHLRENERFNNIKRFILNFIKR